MAHRRVLGCTPLVELRTPTGFHDIVPPIILREPVFPPPEVEFYADDVRKDEVICMDITGGTLLLPKVLPEIDADDVESEWTHKVWSTGFAANKKPLEAFADLEMV